MKDRVGLFDNAPIFSAPFRKSECLATPNYIWQQRHWHMIDDLGFATTHFIDQMFLGYLNART